MASKRISSFAVIMVAISFFNGLLTPCTILSQNLDCQYDPQKPSILSAKRSFYAVNYKCAEQELKDFLAIDTLSIKSRADAHILLGEVYYTMLKDEDKKAEIDEKVSNENGGLIDAAMVSDAFFPFRDGVDVGLKEGITSVIHPGGSENDYQSIEACNEAGATMVYTGQRSFKH